MTFEQAQRLWQPETVYLNTASYGLPPAPAWEELQAVLADWRRGRTSWEGWGDYTERARASFARTVGVPTEWIAVGAIGIDAIHEHDLRLANRFRAGLGLPPGDSAIVSAEFPEAEEKLRGSRVMAAARAGLLRTSWHVYNTDDDVDELLETLNLEGAVPFRVVEG